VWFSFRRQWKVRQVGWVAFALLGVTALVVGLVSRGDVWRMDTRPRPISQLKPWLTGAKRPALNAVLGVTLPAADEVTPTTRPMTPAEYAADRVLAHESVPGSPDDLSVRWAVYAAFRAVVNDERVREDFAFTNFSRLVVFSLYVSFLLPLFTLAYAAGAIGHEREGRTLLWLITRPLPRWAVYVAKLLGLLPWSVGASVFAFATLGLVGGEQGLKAVGVFWPLAVAGGVAFGCLFHMVGALFRRPTIVALVYVFFFELVLANLPGGLKQYSLNYYLKSLFYHWLTAAAPTVRPAGLDTYEPAEPATAWVVLMMVSVAVTAVGAWLFGRQEPKDET
jgi:ABC-type transport system involved in multi-copper enzyme maturation permease subunit